MAARWRQPRAYNHAEQGKERAMTQTLMQKAPRNEMPDVVRAMAERAETVTGDATIIDVFANSPAAMAFFGEDFYGKLFYGGAVPVRLKELARIKLSKVHGCQFCNRHNTAASLAAGVTQAQIDALDAYEDGPFDDGEKAVLRLADQIALTNMQGQLTKPLYDALKRHFDDGQIVELAMVMAILGGLNKMAFVLDIVEKEAYCPFQPGAAAAE